jgi:tetratricopeptide (TPR) repeat protein
MTLRSSLLIFLAAAGLAASQNAAPSPEDAALAKIFEDVRKLGSEKKYEQALAKLREAEALKPDSTVVQNARGSIYTSMKDYERARECFKKAGELQPGSFEARFNLSELDFVEGKYEAAADAFTKLLAANTGAPRPVRHLVQFKILVCALRLNDIEKATELAKIFAFPDDSPAGHFAKIAFAAQKGDFTGAAAGLASAQKAFGADDTMPYVDTLVEARWLTLKSPEPKP